MRMRALAYILSTHEKLGMAAIPLLGRPRQLDLYDLLASQSSQISELQAPWKTVSRSRMGRD